MRIGSRHERYVDGEERIMNIANVHINHLLRWHHPNKGAFTLNESIPKQQQQEQPAKFYYIKCGKRKKREETRERELMK